MTKIEYSHLTISSVSRLSVQEKRLSLFDSRLKEFPNRLRMHHRSMW